MAETKFRKGQHVKFNFGTRFVKGIIKEDRGPIGVKGRHLYLIEFRSWEDAPSPSEIELPAVNFQLVQQKSAAR